MYKDKMATIEITYLAMMTAACVVGRFAFQFIPNFQPMTTMFLLFTFYFGLTRGLIVCLLSVIISNFYFGMGIWTIQQIASFSVLILLFSLLTHSKIFKKSLVLQVIFAVLAGYIYGFIISFTQIFIYAMPNFWVYYLQGVSFDTLHAVGNGAFYILLAPVFKGIFQSQYNKLEKIKKR